MKNTKIAKTVPLYVGIAAACILLCGIVLFTVGALADQESVPALAYGQTSDGSGVVVYGIGSFKGDVLSIPESYEGLPVVAIASRAFIGNTTLQSVYLPETMESVGEEAFKH